MDVLRSLRNGDLGAEWEHAVLPGVAEAGEPMEVEVLASVRLIS